MSTAGFANLSTATPPCYGQIVDVDAEALEVEIMGRDRPLIVDFYATWHVLAS